ncbi:hypothetical protein NVP1210O_18 [Vibrio phage 1.210.O._10N.222.52.C2]|nr:hypothetical protein NVP1210O_18 [Vibrio phage 1.210.O._10N.222.52.C2]
MGNVITASSENKCEKYELLVALHTLAVQLTRCHGSGWYISESWTDCTAEEYLTIVSNGSVQIEARTIGEVHNYTKSPVKNA